MVTTFERLAKVLKGYVKPANWIERAFASVGGALVPSYTLEDENKVLSVAKVEDGYDETVIVQEQTLTLGSNKRAFLEEASYDFSSLTNGDKVIVLVTSNGETTEIECTYAITDISAEDVIRITCGSKPALTYTAGTANATYTFKAVTRETKYKAESAWVEGGSGALLVHEDNDGVLDKTWQEIFDAIHSGNGAVLLTADEQYTEISPIYSAAAPIVEGTKYVVNLYIYGSEAPSIYKADESDGYPQYSET